MLAEQNVTSRVKLPVAGGIRGVMKTSNYPASHPAVTIFVLLS
jgi:hypothetical protein